MMNWLVECLVWFLAAYGLFALLQGVAGLIRARISGLYSGVRLVLLVKNAEEYIEYIIRSTAKRNFMDRFIFNQKMAVIDMNSTDHTYQLLERLKNDFPHIEVLAFSERNAAFGNTDDGKDENISIFSPSSK